MLIESIMIIEQTDSQRAHIVENPQMFAIEHKMLFKEIQKMYNN